MKMNSLNIMIVGVGGQGTLLSSRVLGNVALKEGYDVKVSEVHGMAQRGGSVVTYVKIGEKVFSPLIEKGEADVIISFEQLEALRWAEYLKPGGKLIVNSQKINPMPVITGKLKYPDDITGRLKRSFRDVVETDALAAARKCGNIKAVNMVLLGILARDAGIDKSIWIEAMREIIPAKLIDVNIKAFEEGYKTLQGGRS
jgi:indolepyruvate ferredoxin oxidoreductase beta subunit